MFKFIAVRVVITFPVSLMYCALLARLMYCLGVPLIGVFVVCSLTGGAIGYWVHTELKTYAQRLKKCTVFKRCKGCVVPKEESDRLCHCCVHTNNLGVGGGTEGELVYK